ncbi:hypothetical protein [Methanococcoides sp. FTZ1]|uniref:hypothetical protein n=1 Tax=Methanococcoides sp. FTZ1 TaxID=3439061 RepID=UPI003F860B40
MEEKTNTERKAANRPEITTEELLHNIGKPHLGTHVPPSLSEELPALDGIEFMPHKTAGLQSPADMWIDRGRMTENLHHKAVVEKILKVRTL